jgi:hypothetical protein
MKNPSGTRYSWLQCRIVGSMIDRFLFAFCCAAVCAGFWWLVLYMFHVSDSVIYGLWLFVISFFVMYVTGRHG